MYRLVSVYFSNGCFLAHANSTQDEQGVFIAHSPGIGISIDSPDAFLGHLIIHLATYCKDTFPDIQSLRDIPFPLASIGGVKTWGALAKKSPHLLHVQFNDSTIELHKNSRDGSNYVKEPDFTTVRLPSTVDSSTLGKKIRDVLVPAP